MGGGAYSTNNRVNAAVASAAASRASTPVFTYNTGDPLPENYRSPAKFYSEMTPDEQRANDELRRIAELNKPDPNVYVPTTYSQVPTSQNYGAAPTYDSAEEAFSTYGSFFEEVQGQMEQTASVYNYNQYDPADFARAGMNSPRDAGKVAASDRIGEYLTKNDIPPFIDVDGQRLYFTTGLGGYPSGDIEDDKYKASGSYEAHGPAGTYSTIHVPPEGLFDSLHPALRGGIALATGGMSEAFISATQAISGETLHLNDWLNLANAGMEIAKAKASQPTTSTGSTRPRTQAEMAADGDIIYAKDANYWETSGSLNPISGATTTPESFGSLAGDLQEIFEGLPFDLAVGLGTAIFEEDSDIGEAIQAATEAGQSTTTITDEGEVELQPTGDTPDMRETVVDLEQPELASEDITADPVEEQVIAQPTLPEETEETVVVQPTESTDNEGGGGGGADTGGGETGAGSSGTGVPETGSGIPGTSGSGGLAVEEGAVTPVLDTMSVPNPDFDPDVYDVYYEREIYRIALEETDPVLRERLKAAYEEYGGKHVDDLKAGKSFEEVYGDYPPDSIEVPYEEPTLDRDAFEAQYPDGYLSDGGTFSNIDTNGDGVVSDTEKFDYEHNRGSGQGGDPSEVVQAILDALRLEVNTPDPSTGLPTDTIVDIGTEVGPTDPAIGSGQEDTTTDSTGVPSDTTDTDGTIGDGGGGVGTDDGGGAGGGTTGGGAGSGEADSGAGAGEGEGDGSGSGVGDGSGTGTGTGEGSGDGSGSGSGNGDGSGSGSGVGAGNGTRTTDSLFGDMLQLETQIGSTQELLPFNVMSTPTRAVYKQPQVDPIQQFLQHQQEVQRLRNIPQRMLTNDQFLKRFEY
mgnify:CR=1 FL=1